MTLPQSKEVKLQEHAETIFQVKLLRFDGVLVATQHGNNRWHIVN